MIMFIHGRTGKVYYSVREKINYYNKIVKGSVKADKALIEKAKKRLPELQKINNQTYDKPSLIVTDDKHFGNTISKPRLCVVVDRDNNLKRDKILVAQMNDRTTKSIILDNYPKYQIDNRISWIDKSEVYETKYFTNIKNLTKYDNERIKEVYKKK